MGFWHPTEWNYLEALKIIKKDKNDKNVSHLKITEAVLVHCNVFQNDYQQDSRVLYTFVPDKPFRSLLEISPTNHIFIKNI